MVRIAIVIPYASMANLAWDVFQEHTEQMRLQAKAEELYHEARTQPGMPYEAFNESLATRNLYPLCGVQRKSKPVGRPRKQN